MAGRARHAEAALRRACEDDRRWFASHPRRTARLRRRIAGEFHPCEEQAGGGRLVLVVQVAPGVRLRSVAPLLRTSFVSKDVP